MGELGESWMYFYFLGVALELILLMLILRYAWTWPRTAPLTGRSEVKENREIPYSA